MWFSGMPLPPCLCGGRAGVQRVAGEALPRHRWPIRAGLLRSSLSKLQGVGSSPAVTLVFEGRSQGFVHYTAFSSAATC